MLKDPVILGYLIVYLLIIVVGYWVMTIFVGIVSSLNKKAEESKKQKKEKEKEQNRSHAA